MLPLDRRFAVIKKALVKPEYKQKVVESYGRLLKTLESEIALIEKNGSAMIPQIDFNEVRGNGNSFRFSEVQAELTISRWQDA